MEGKKNNKRAAEDFNQDTNEIQQTSKRQKVYDAFITVNEKGRCSFELITDTRIVRLKHEVKPRDSPKHEVKQGETVSSSQCDIPSYGNGKVILDDNKVDTVVDSIPDTQTDTSAQKGNVTEPKIEDIREKLKTEIDCYTIPDPSEYVALDCEFVGVKKNTDKGVKLDISALGRCSIVNYEGRIICDIYSRPKETITHYRTKWSGIRKSDLKAAIPEETALKQIANLIKNKIVVGHALKNDFDVLGIDHPAEKRRDTSLYPPFVQTYGNNQPVGLKTLAKFLFGEIIQKKSHCSVVDSQTTMDVFKTVREEWENRIIRGEPQTYIPVNKTKKKKKRKAKPVLNSSQTKESMPSESHTETHILNGSNTETHTENGSNTETHTENGSENGPHTETHLQNGPQIEAHTIPINRPKEFPRECCYCNVCKNDTSKFEGKHYGNGNYSGYNRMRAFGYQSEYNWRGYQRESNWDHYAYRERDWHLSRQYNRPRAIHVHDSYFEDKYWPDSYSRPGPYSRPDPYSYNY